MELNLKMNPLCKHLLIDFFECSKDILNDEKKLREVLTYTAKICGYTILNTFSQKFLPQGIIVIVIIDGSHLLLHTWTEYNYVACDISIYDNLNPYNIIDYLKQEFGTEKFNIKEQVRGFNAIDFKVIELETFARKHNFKINPQKNLVGWAKLVITLERCPCKPGRQCPCNESLDELKQRGYCVCKFFVDENYLKNQEGKKK